MSAEFLTEWVAPLPLAERAKALNLIGFTLTLHAREVALSESGLEMLRCVNELQHRITAQVGHYLEGEESKAYPIDVFARMLFESAEQSAFGSHLEAAVKSAYGRRLRATHDCAG